MARTDPRNSAKYWHDPGTSGLSLLCADFTTQDYAPHVHDALVVAATEQGGAVFNSRGVTDLARPGALLVFNAGEPQSSRMGPSPRWRYRGFYLEQAALDAVSRDAGLARTPGFLRNTLPDPALAADFLVLHRALEGEDDPFRRQELMAGAFGTLFRRHGCSGAAPALRRDGGLLPRALELMRGRYAENLTLEGIARTLGLTPFQLIVLFKRATGMTPHAYLTQIRLGMACRALRGGRSIVAAASACGFYDQSALSRHFKRCYGITPLQYARARPPLRRSAA